MEGRSPRGGRRLPGPASGRGGRLGERTATVIAALLLLAMVATGIVTIVLLAVRTSPTPS